MNLATEQRKQIIIPITAASSRFGKFAKESGQGVRQADVKKDEKLEAMIQAWKGFGSDWQGMGSDEFNYRNAAAFVKELNVSSEDIMRFCVALARYQETRRFPGKAGIFLSALANSCQDAGVTLLTGNFQNRINHLGFKNTRDIIIEGDAGDHLGHFMKTGSITLNGNAARDVGNEMESGSIIINGDAGNDPGWIMKGGTMIINGNAGAEVGALMSGGEIHLNGGFESIAGKICRIYGGQIFHKGQLIWPKGGGSQ